MKTNYTKPGSPNIMDSVTIIRNAEYQNEEDEKYIGRTGTIIANSEKNTDYVYGVMVEGFTQVLKFNYKELYKLSL